MRPVDSRQHGQTKTKACFCHCGWQMWVGPSSAPTTVIFFPNIDVSYVLLKAVFSYFYVEIHAVIRLGNLVNTSS